jgi:hypothetical protein
MCFKKKNCGTYVIGRFFLNTRNFHGKLNFGNDTNHFCFCLQRKEKEGGGGRGGRKLFKKKKTMSCSCTLKKMQIHNLFNYWNKLKNYYYAVGDFFLNRAKRNSLDYHKHKKGYNVTSKFT